MTRMLIYEGDCEHCGASVREEMEEEMDLRDEERTYCDSCGNFTKVPQVDGYTVERDTRD